MTISPYAASGLTNAIRKGNILNKGAKKMKRIPKFKTNEEAARFWETHSFEDYHNDTKDVEIVFTKRPNKTISLVRR
jgi:hypothetical protein